MARRGVKDRLLRELAAAEQRERELVRHNDDERPAGTTTWTAKDNLAHLAHWRRYAVSVLEAARAGIELPAHDPQDEINARVFVDNRDRPAAEVEAEARGSYSQLAELIHSLPEAVLRRPRPDGPGEAWQVVPPNSYRHLDEHLAYWRRDHGTES